MSEYILLAPTHPLSTFQPYLLCSGPQGATRVLFSLASNWVWQMGSASWASRNGGGGYGGNVHVLIPSSLGQHFLAASLHLMWHFLPSGFLLMATWFCSHFVSLPFQAKQWKWHPTVSSLRVLHCHLAEFPISCHSHVRGLLSSFFHHLTWVCHLFPSRTSTDAVNKETILSM